MQPERMPGSSCGSITRQNTLSGEAPSERPAFSTCGSSFCRLAQTEITMKGISTWVSAMATPVMLKSRRTGSLVMPRAISVLLISPSLPKRMAQPSVRTTTEISSGPRMTIRKSARQGLLMRARISVSGTPKTTHSSVTPSARPPVRRKISW